jgi:hypothetical protein
MIDDEELFENWDRTFQKSEKMEFANKKTADENSAKNFYSNYDDIFGKKKTFKTQEGTEKKEASDNYKDNFDAIFGKKKDKVKP